MIWSSIDIFHADSLSGPMKAMKIAFEADKPGFRVNLVSGRSQELAERIVKGDSCDVFVPSSPAVIEEELMVKRVAGTHKTAASWSVIFSANEMVVITGKGNPLKIGSMADLAKPGIRFSRVTGEKDMASQRTITFVTNALTREGKPDLSRRLIEKAAVEPGKPHTVIDTIADVAAGKADAGVVYYSAAVEAKDKVDSLRFQADLNLSGEIRNAATVPATAKNPAAALSFVRFILSDRGRRLLESAGQPAVFPAIFRGTLPAELKLGKASGPRPARNDNTF
jgi:molybdate transport system substrate-binding protein